MKASIVLLLMILASCATEQDPEPETISNTHGSRRMDLGAFSVSLAVKDLGASRAFYEKLGFTAILGDPAQNWLILQNGISTIGLFQGMFEKNILTFNPGWTQGQETLETFTDVRDIQRILIERGIEPQSKAEESTDGPASLIVIDPDGNPILLDQHVPRPTGGR